MSLIYSIEPEVILMNGQPFNSLRCGKFDGGSTVLQSGEIFGFDSETYLGNIHRVKLEPTKALSTLQIGDLLFLNGGRTRLMVQMKGRGHAQCVIIAGGKVTSGMDIKIQTSNEINPKPH